MTQDNDIAIKTQGITKTYSNKMVLNEIDLSIKHGQFVILLGSNGSGKSTLLKILGTIIEPTSGNAWINGNSVITNQVKVRESIGFMFQSNALDVNRTVLDNLTFTAALFGISKKEINDRILTLLKMFDLSDVTNKLVRQLSGGMQRLIDVTRCMLHKPSILLLDEPTSGLDAAHRIQFFNHLKSLQQNNNITILLTSHHLDESQYCDKLLMMKEGKIILGDHRDIVSS
ncbi:MAG: ABC transporter ATP-binding protein [Candidatus Berkiella sp.]